jgi:hypothetical protein
MLGGLMSTISTGRSRNRGGEGRRGREGEREGGSLTETRGADLSVPPIDS